MAYGKSLRQMTVVVVAIACFCAQVAATASTTPDAIINRHHGRVRAAQSGNGFQADGDPMRDEFYSKPRAFKMVGQLYPLLYEHRYAVAVVAVVLVVVAITVTLAAFYLWLSRRRDDCSSSTCSCDESCAQQCYCRTSSAKTTMCEP